MKDYRLSINCPLHGLIEVFVNLRNGLPKSGELTGFCVELNALVQFDLANIIVYEVL